MRRKFQIYEILKRASLYVEIFQKTNCHTLLSSKSFKKKYMVVSGIQKIKNFRKFSVPKVEKKHMVKS